MKAKPVAWLMMESGPNGESPRVMAGRMWISEDVARAAAKRMRNGKWVRRPVPVYTAEQLGSEP